jgi:hypothetical protein
METKSTFYQEQIVAHLVPDTTLDFNDLRNDDCILIVTENSIYSFVITDAAQMRGKLSGGSQHFVYLHARLRGAVTEHDHRFHADTARLKTNARARFLMLREEAVEEMGEVLTSVITRLICIRR